MFDPNLVGGHDHHVGVVPGGCEFVADLVHAGCDLGFGGSVLVDGPGCVEGQPGHVEQEVVGSLGGVDHVEVGVEPVGEVGYGPELGGESLSTEWLLQHRHDFCALLGGEFGCVEVACVAGVYRCESGLGASLVAGF